MNLTDKVKLNWRDDKSLNRSLRPIGNVKSGSVQCIAESTPATVTLGVSAGKRWKHCAHHEICEHSRKTRPTRAFAPIGKD